MHGPDPKQPPRPIARVHVDNIPPRLLHFLDIAYFVPSFCNISFACYRLFYEKFLSRGIPVVLEGLVSDHQAQEEWEVSQIFTKSKPKLTIVNS